MADSNVVPIHPDVPRPNVPPASWVLMDAGDTFIYGYPTFYEALRDCWAQTGSAPLDLPVFQEAVKRYMKNNPRQDFHDQEHFTRYFRSLYRGVLEDLQYPGDLNPAVEYLWGEWLSGHRLRLFDDSRAALMELREAGLLLGVVSNWDNTFEGVLQRLGVADWFQVKVASCRIGISKPDTRIFRHALDQTGVPPEQVWFLGDQLTVDILPAKALGMRTIHVDYYDRGDGAALADFTAPSLSVAARIILANRL